MTKLLIGGIFFALGCVLPEDTGFEPEGSLDDKTVVLGVNVIEAKLSEKVFDTSTCFGTVKPKRTSYLAFGRGGRVASILRGVGDAVAADDKIAEVDHQELEDQKSEIEDALTVAQQQLSRLNPNSRATATQRRIGELEQQIATLETRQQEVDRELAKGVIRAPYAGIIAERRAEEGDEVPSGRPMFKILVDEAPNIELNVDSKLAEQIRVDQEVYVKHENELIKTRVLSKSPEVSQVSHTQQVTLELASEDPNLSWTYGNTVEAQFWTTTDRSGFWLPISALQREVDGLWSALVVEEQEGQKFVARRVLELVQLADDHALVQGGLSDGDLVIVNGSNRVVPGQHVTATVLKSSFQQPGPPVPSE